ncbi:MAG: hypothetical protein IT565_14050 [Rhodospirillales bacterium]|nr:hypothetical protein [Rhodospirillales bacterium]
MSIMVVVGDPGNGKGIYSMSLIEQVVLSGRALYTNIELTTDCPYQGDVARIDDPAGNWPVYRGNPPREGKRASDDYMAFWHYTLPGSVVIIDEADLYFDCSDFSAMGRDIRAFLKQHRKLGLDLIFIVQNLANLYVRIRRLATAFDYCEWTWRSKAWPQKLANLIGRERAINLTWFTRSRYRDELFTPGGHLGDGFLSYKQASRFFGWYPTDQLIGDLSHLKWRENNDGDA